MKIGLVVSVKPSHPYLEDERAPLFDLHYLRISPWLWFRSDVRPPAGSPERVHSGPLDRSGRGSALATGRGKA